MIKLEGITKSFGSLQVLKGIDLEINKGEIVSFIDFQINAFQHL